VRRMVERSETHLGRRHAEKPMMGFARALPILRVGFLESSCPLV
jgi:hypothetical protein